MKKTKVVRNRAQINLTIDPEIHAAAMKAAYAEGETLSRLTERLYRQWLRSNGVMEPATDLDGEIARATREVRAAQAKFHKHT